MHAADQLEHRLERVRLLLLDVDGVLTAGGVGWSNDGIELKTFHIRDGLGIRLWQKAGGLVGIVTGRSSHVVELRAGELGIEIVRQGVDEKHAVVAVILEELGLSWQEVAFMGDDLPDLAAVEASGVGVAVADACRELREVADLVTEARGGHGAVREVVERLLVARGAWEPIVRRFRAVRG